MSEHISSMFKGLTSSIVKKKSLNDTKRLFTNQINNRIQNLWVWSHVAIQSEKEREREREREMGTLIVKWDETHVHLHFPPTFL
jgi:IS4 transposase